MTDSARSRISAVAQWAQGLSAYLRASIETMPAKGEMGTQLLERSAGEAHALLEQALLRAFADTYERAEPDPETFFQAALRAPTPEVASALAPLILPAALERTVSTLTALWEQQPAISLAPWALQELARLFAKRFRETLQAALLSSENLDDCSLAEASDGTAAPSAGVRPESGDAWSRLHGLIHLLAPEVSVPAQVDMGSPPRRRWEIQVPGERTPLTHHLGLLTQTPLVWMDEEGLNIYVGRRDGAVLAYRVREDEVTFRWEWSLPANTVPPEALALWHDHLVIAPQPTGLAVEKETRLFLVDRHTGQTAATISVPASRLGPPTVVDDIAYTVAADGTLWAVDLARRDVSWSLSQVGSFSDFPPLAVERWLVLPAKHSTLVCVDREKRAFQWRFEAQPSAVSAPPHFNATPVVAERNVYAVNHNGALYALELETGKPIWPEPYQTGGILERSPVIARNLILIAGRDHRVHAVDRRSGARRWESHDLGRRILSQPAVVGSVVFVAPLRSELYALHLEDGTPVWPDPLEMPDRVRGDLVSAGNVLVAPARNGLLVGIEIVDLARSHSPQDLLVQGRWAEALSLLAQEGAYDQAARLCLERGLNYQAGRLLEKAGCLEEAAQVLAQDDAFPPSIRRAAELYRRLGHLTRTAHLLEQVGDRAIAAQIWEEAGELEKAAALYKALGEERLAARLYAQAGQFEKAADLYQAAGDLSQARAVLEQAQDPSLEKRIQALERELIRHGDRHALDAQLARAHSAAERAQLYQDAGEWLQAAEEWLRAGRWRRAVELLLKHGHREQALRILQQSPEEEKEARRLQAELLRDLGRIAEALSLYQQLDDLEGQAQCYQTLGDLVQAARLYEAAGHRLEAPQMDEETRERVIACFKAAATLYRRLDRRRYLLCRQKVHYHRSWPWLSCRITPKGSFVLEEPNVLQVTLLNEGRGHASQVEVEIYNENNWVTVTGLSTVEGLGPLVEENLSAQLVPHRRNDIVLRVRLRWHNPDGTRKEIELWDPWVIHVVDPSQSPADSSVSVTVYGDYYAHSTVVEGNLYQDQAYHQAGDRVDIRRDLSNRGIPCLECHHDNPLGARFCEACGHELGRK